MAVTFTECGIRPEIARRKTKHGTGVGLARWVVERTFALLCELKRLPVRFDRRHEIHETFLGIAAAWAAVRRPQIAL